MEGLIFGILRYFSKMLMVNFHPQMWGCLVGYYSKSPRLRPAISQVRLNWFLHKW